MNIGKRMEARHGFIENRIVGSLDFVFSRCLGVALDQGLDKVQGLGQFSETQTTIR